MSSGQAPPPHPLERYWTAAEHSLDRWLHRWRRRRALAQLRAHPRPGSVLFVCYGNVYRSPYAARAFEAALPAEVRGEIVVHSAGFVSPNRPVPARAVEQAALRAIDLGTHRSSLIAPERVRAAELVVVMDPLMERGLRRRYQLARHSLLVLGDLDPQPIQTRTIRDPGGQPPAVLRESYARVERCVGQLVRAITGPR